MMYMHPRHFSICLLSGTLTVQADMMERLPRPLSHLKIFPRYDRVTLGVCVQYLQVYWIDLDYLNVARAALRCSAPFTAMLYVEYWCKAKYNRLTLQDVDLLNQVTFICPEQPWPHT